MTLLRSLATKVIMKVADGCQLMRYFHFILLSIDIITL